MIANLKTVFEANDLELLMKAFSEIIDWDQVQSIADCSRFLRNIIKFTFTVSEVETLVQLYSDQSAGFTATEMIVYAMLVINHLFGNAADAGIIQPELELALSILDSAAQKAETAQQHSLKTKIGRLRYEITMVYGLHKEHSLEGVVAFLPAETLRKSSAMQYAFFSGQATLPITLEDRTPTDPYHSWAILPYTPRPW
jgi:hypothetical protein